METRKTTKWLLDQVEQGLFHNETLIRDLINFMSESDVDRFCAQYGYEESEDEESEDEESEDEESEDEDSRLV